MLAQHLKVGICVPSGPQWDADFGMCLTTMFTHILTRPMKGVRQIHFMLFNERSSLLPKSRQSLLDKAIKANCDYALFIDSDQTFPSNLLYRMLHWDKSLVACNVATKSIPANWTARSKPQPGEHPGGHVLFSDPDKHGLEEVWRIGTGIMLIKLNMLSAIPRPWFSVTYKPELDEFTGEDWYFCEKLEAAGVKLYIDHDLSREVGHVGKLIYDHRLIGQVVQEEVEQVAE